jgi:hypothetical protein
VLVVILTCALAAVQLLPLFELVSQSHRSDGVRLFPVIKSAYLNGFFFSQAWDIKHPSFPVAGSALFCLLAFLSLVCGPGPREKGYILAVKRIAKQILQSICNKFRSSRVPPLFMVILSAICGHG